MDARNTRNCVGMCSAHMYMNAYYTQCNVYKCACERISSNIYDDINLYAACFSSPAHKSSCLRARIHTRTPRKCVVWLVGACVYMRAYVVRVYKCGFDLHFRTHTRTQVRTRVRARDEQAAERRTQRLNFQFDLITFSPLI